MIRKIVKCLAHYWKLESILTHCFQVSYANEKYYNFFESHLKYGLRIELVLKLI